MFFLQLLFLSGKSREIKDIQIFTVYVETIHLRFLGDRILSFCSKLSVYTLSSINEIQ